MPLAMESQAPAHVFRMFYSVWMIFMIPYANNYVWLLMFHVIPIKFGHFVFASIFMCDNLPLFFVLMLLF